MKLATLALATLATVATVAETVKTASQPWVTNNVAQAVAPVTAGVATNAAMIAALDHRVDKTALNWVYIPDPSSPWTCTMSGKELLLDYVGPIVSAESFSFRWQCSTNSNWWLEYVVYRKWSNSSLVLQADGNFWECDGEWRHKAGEEHPRCYEPCDANSLSFKTAIGSLITMTRDTTDLRAEPALLRNAYLNDIWEVEKDVATNAAEIAALSQSIDYSTNNTALVDTIETVAPQPGDYATVSNLAVNAVQTEADPTVPSWAKASSKPGYTLNEICPDAENWLGVQGDAGRCIKVLAGTVGGQIVGGMRVTASTLNDNNMTTYTYGGVAVRRNGTNQDYLWDGSSTNGIVRRGELASVATSGSYNDLTNAPDLGGYSTTGAVAQVARDLSAVSNVAASAVQTETDPTVPNWAKVTTPPYLTSETDPTVPSWAKVTTPPYLTSETDPTVPSAANAATNYTDAVAARYLPLTGGELSGDLLLPATNEVSVGGLDAGSTHYGYGYIYHDSSYLLTLPNKSGTFALTADVAAATNALVRGPSVYFATCPTAASTRAKVLVFDSADSSRLGDIATRGNTLFVKFDKAQTYNGVPQLSINGTTYLIYMVGTTGAARYEWVAGEVVQFVYDGERWMLVDAGRATTSYYGVTKLTTSVSSTSTSTALTPASLSGYIAGTIDDTPVYATNTAHAVGARARYGNYTWECTNAVAAGVAWNEADWRELPPLQAQIDELSSVSAAEYASATNRIAALEAQLAGLEAALHNINTGE